MYSIMDSYESYKLIRTSSGDMGGCIGGHSSQLEAVTKGGGEGGRQVCSYWSISSAEGKPFLAWPAGTYFTMEIHLSIQTFIFQSKTGPDAKAFPEIYNSFQVNSAVLYCTAESICLASRARILRRSLS
jgi:hypothetical protein